MRVADSGGDNKHGLLAHYEIRISRTKLLEISLIWWCNIEWKHNTFVDTRKNEGVFGNKCDSFSFAFLALVTSLGFTVPSWRNVPLEKEHFCMKVMAISETFRWSITLGFHLSQQNSSLLWVNSRLTRLEFKLLDSTNFAKFNVKSVLVKLLLPSSQIFVSVIPEKQPSYAFTNASQLVQWWIIVGPRTKVNAGGGKRSGRVQGLSL